MNTWGHVLGCRLHGTQTSIRANHCRELLEIDRTLGTTCRAVSKSIFSNIQPFLAQPHIKAVIELTLTSNHSLKYSYEVVPSSTHSPSMQIKHLTCSSNNNARLLRVTPTSGWSCPYKLSRMANARFRRRSALSYLRCTLMGVTQRQRSDQAMVSRNAGTLHTSRITHPR